jgi:hypothetical protein
VRGAIRYEILPGEPAGELARQPAGNAMYCMLAALREQTANVLHSVNIA